MSNIKNKSIFKKAKKDEQFAQISNVLINNRKLSYKALGILTYILSKPDDWEVYISDLVRDRDAETSVRSGVNELIKQKYMQRYKVIDAENGKINHWETLVGEEPFDENDLIYMVKEKYLKNSNGTIMLNTIKYKDFERTTPIVLFREVLPLSQNPKEVKKSIVSPHGGNLNVGKPNVENNRQLILNITNTNSNQYLITSKNLKKIFEECICGLRKTTSVKFEKILKAYDPGMIFQVIQECMKSNTYSYKKFEIAFQDYAERGCKTREDVAVAAAEYRKDIKETKKQEKKTNFHNFEGRDYNYDNLQKMLDGEMEYNTDDLYN